MRRLLLRDLLILALTVIAWMLAPTLPQLAMPAAIGAGICAFQFHEWGHFLGGTVAGARMTPAQVLWSPFLFRFDASGNTRHQFLHMSWPGFAATAVFLAVFAGLLPDTHAATGLTRQIGQGLAAVTVVVEVPLALWTLAGGRIPPVPVWLPGREKP